DTDFTEFYRLLKLCKQFPTTSQPPPEAFERLFREAKEAGDDVIAILISSGLSGTLQSARTAQAAVGYERIHLIDTLTAIMPQRLLVEYAVKLRDAGTGIGEMLSECEYVRDRLRVWGMIDSLTYLYMGGRLSRTAALAGNLLHIRPIVTSNEKGVIALAGRGRNHQALMTRFAADQPFDDRFPVIFGYTDTAEGAQKLMAQATEAYGLRETSIHPIGGLVGAHVGPNGAALAYVMRRKVK
ncbi:MAG: DegV family protein, partial [Oscillospiraceae bacterium]|nr:DegV family protein [Oscillospiraceae bacterium]